MKTKNLSFTCFITYDETPGFPCIYELKTKLVRNQLFVNISMSFDVPFIIKRRITVGFSVKLVRAK